MTSYETVYGIIAFLIFSHLVLITGGGADVFFDVEGLDDLSFSPEIPQNDPTFVHLEEDRFSSENVTFVDPENIDDPDFDANNVAVTLEDGTESGFVEYDISGLEYVATQSTRFGFFEFSSMSAQFPPDDREFALRGSQDWISQADGADSIVVEFSEVGDYVYNLEVDRVSPTGFFGTIFSWLIAILSYPIELWSLFREFPFYIQLFYGAILTWMIVDILQVG